MLSYECMWCWVWSSQVILHLQCFIVFARLRTSSEESSGLEWFMNWLDFLNAKALVLSILAVHTLHRLLNHGRLFGCLGTTYYHSGACGIRDTWLDRIEGDSLAQKSLWTYFFRWVWDAAGYATWLLPKGHYTQPLPFFVESVHHQPLCRLTAVTVGAENVALATCCSSATCRKKRLLVGFSGMFIPLSVIRLWVRSFYSMDGFLVLERIATSTSSELSFWTIFIWSAADIRRGSSNKRSSWLFASISQAVILTSMMVNVSIHDLIVRTKDQGTAANSLSERPGILHVVSMQMCAIIPLLPRTVFIPIISLHNFHYGD